VQSMNTRAALLSSLAPLKARLLPMLLAALLVVAQQLGAPAASFAAEADIHAADRQALLKIFQEMEDGINAQDVGRMIAQMHADATVTWLNGEVSRGHDEIRAYYDRMVKGERRILEKYLTAAKVGAPARFIGSGGDVAVAYGTMADQFFPVSRGPFTLDSRWTSTSTKVDGQWKIAALHLSANVFTNPLIDEAKNAAPYAGAGGAIIGFALAWILGRLMRRPRS
jgi:ketosteroid isomerase-like protein